MDKPILFSGPMIRALLDGRKTMTRRILKSQPSDEAARDGRYLAEINNVCRPSPIKYAVGDRLWVREAWLTESHYYDDLAPSEMGGEETILYSADADWSMNKSTGRKRASMHMPRWASRLTLIVTNVKIERLKDISPADAIREGIIPSANCATIDCDTPNPVDDFRVLWESINGPGSWEANPWVAAYSFEVHRYNIDQMPALPASREG